MAVSNTLTERANQMLSVIPDAHLNSLSRHLKPVSFDRGDRVYETGDRISRCYFPLNGMVSLLSNSGNGDTVEIGFAGFEGIVGLPVFFGTNEMPYQALVQAPSDCLALDAALAAELFESSDIFHDAVLRYSHVVLKQVSQTCVCNQFHTIEARICRWLSVMCERSGEHRLRLTQEFLALMLGVQRTSVGYAAGAMQQRGIIRYSRGIIEVLDFERLKKMACECFEVVRAEFQRFLAELRKLAPPVLGRPA